MEDLKKEHYIKAEGYCKRRFFMRFQNRKVDGEDDLVKFHMDAVHLWDELAPPNLNTGFNIAMSFLLSQKKDYHYKKLEGLGFKHIPNLNL